jgi:predicted O-methyltransferase YrrM
MVSYSLSHLTQSPDQLVGGPIQDDEALLLFAIIKTCRINKILEVGGLEGYSAKNFLAAIDGSGFVISVDTSFVEKLAENHITIQKNINEVDVKDIGPNSLDLVFFDAHDYESQMSFFNRMLNLNVITDDTLIALHDTNLHPKKLAPWSYFIPSPEDSGWVHQDCERMMVNTLAYQYGYHAINFHTKMSSHNEALPCRHGITVCRKFKALKI